MPAASFAPILATATGARRTAGHGKRPGYAKRRGTDKQARRRRR